LKSVRDESFFTNVSDFTHLVFPNSETSTVSKFGNLNKALALMSMFGLGNSQNRQRLYENAACLEKGKPETKLRGDKKIKI
jgi:hypothetical protein